jgi:hypothetical protein
MGVGVHHGSDGECNDPGHHQNQSERDRYTQRHIDYRPPEERPEHGDRWVGCTHRSQCPTIERSQAEPSASALEEERALDARLEHAAARAPPHSVHRMVGPPAHLFVSGV